MSDKKIGVFIVDDHGLIIEGLRAALTDQPDMQIVGHAQDGKECLDYFEQQQADVALLDINLPDMNGIDLCEELLKRQPHLQVLGLSMFNQRSYVSKMLEKGARGYILKNAGVDEICVAIRQVAKGHLFISREAGDRLYKMKTLSGEELPPITRREREVLKLIADGLTAGEIAEKLFLSHLTIESHRRNLMTKLKAKNAAVLVRNAIENNLI